MTENNPINPDIKQSPLFEQAFGKTPEDVVKTAKEALQNPQPQVNKAKKFYADNKTTVDTAVFLAAVYFVNKRMVKNVVSKQVGYVFEEVNQLRMVVEDFAWMNVPLVGTDAA